MVAQNKCDLKTKVLFLHVSEETLLSLY